MDGDASVRYLALWMGMPVLGIWHIFVLYARSGNT